MAKLSKNTLCLRLASTPIKLIRYAAVTLTLSLTLTLTLVLFGRTVLFALCHRIVILSVRLCDLSCPVLSVTLVHCGQTAGCIKMKLGTEVGLGPGHSVLDGDPASFPKRGIAPNFGPCLLWPNSWMDQDSTWYEVGLGPGHIVRWGPASPFERGTSVPLFSAHVYFSQTVAHLSYC